MTKQTHHAARLKLSPMRVRYASLTMLIASANPPAVHLDDADLRRVCGGLGRSRAGHGERAIRLGLMKGLDPRGLLYFHLMAGLGRQLRNYRAAMFPAEGKKSRSQTEQ